jgi:hypothetical protein
MKTFKLIVHGPKTDLKRGSYGQNSEKRLLLSVLDKRKPTLKPPLHAKSS